MSTKFVLKTTSLTSESAKEALEKAMLEQKPLNLWINKYGEVVGTTLQQAGTDEAIFIRRTEESDNPSFPVCVAVRGRLLTKDGEPMSIADLPKAIKAAQERVRFYTEREKKNTTLSRVGSAATQSNND